MNKINIIVKSKRYSFYLACFCHIISKNMKSGVQASITINQCHSSGDRMSAWVDSLTLKPQSKSLATLLWTRALVTTLSWTDRTLQWLESCECR